MEAVTFFHLRIIPDPLQISFHDPLQAEILQKWPEFTYLELDNFSGEEVFAYARQLAKQSNSIIIFITSDVNQTNGKVSGWLNFIIRQKIETMLFWQGRNDLIEHMKNAFSQQMEIKDMHELLEQMNSKYI